MLSKDKTSFVLYTSFYDALQDLPLDRKGMLLDLIFNYEIHGDTDAFEEHFKDLPNDVKMAFRFIKGQLDKDQEKWRDVCSKRAAAGRKSGVVRAAQQNEQTGTKRTNVHFVEQTGTKRTDNEYDNEYDTHKCVCNNARAQREPSTHTQQLKQVQSRLVNKFYVPGITDAECLAALQFMRSLPNDIVVAAARGEPANTTVSGKEVWHTGTRELDMAAGRRVWDERLIQKYNKKAAA